MLLVKVGDILKTLAPKNTAKDSQERIDKSTPKGVYQLIVLVNDCWSDDINVFILDESLPESFNGVFI